MYRKRMFIALVLAVAVVMAGSACASKTPEVDEPKPSTQPGAEDPSMGLRLAPGLYEIEGGKVQAIGTLEYRDIEGGIWVVVDGTVTDEGADDVAAVIANASKFESELKALEGKQVLADGKKAGDVSIRMAGPEIEIDTIKEMSDTPDNILE